MSKGSVRRPLSVPQQQFADNWDRAFGGTKQPSALREVKYDGMWQHSCTVEMTVMWIGKDETCSWCGAWEEDGDNPPASPNAV
jgi:hypothetical protein